MKQDDRNRIALVVATRELGAFLRVLPAGTTQVWLGLTKLSWRSLESAKKEDNSDRQGSGWIVCRATCQPYGRAPSRTDIPPVAGPSAWPPDPP